MTGSGWNASLFLAPLLERRKLDGLPYKHEWLAEQTGIDRTGITQYTTGSRKLGIKNARRIADALGVSLLELGAPADADPEGSHPVLARLDRVEAEKVATEDLALALAPLQEAILLVASGKRREALRVLSDAGIPA